MRHGFAPWSGFICAQEAAMVDWRTANDRVARVGGWRTYARETLPERAP
jgi:hypothetical protein